MLCSCRKLRGWLIHVTIIESLRYVPPVYACLWPRSRFNCKNALSDLLTWTCKNICKVYWIPHRFFPFQLRIQKITPLWKLSTITSAYFNLRKFCLFHWIPLAQANWMVCLILFWTQQKRQKWQPFNLTEKDAITLFFSLYN